jgi:hypothetical protein
VCVPGSPAPPPSAAIATVTDANTGAVIFQGTLTPQQGDPAILPDQVIQRDVDVHTFTASGDWLIYLTIDNVTPSAFLSATPLNACHLPITSARFTSDSLRSQASASCASFVFDLDQGLATLSPNQAKLLISKYDTDHYFSTLQRTYPVVPTDPPTPFRPQMDIAGGVINAPADGPRDIYFKLIDPKDSAAYAVNDAHPGDNLDTANPAVLMLSDGTSPTLLGQVLHTAYSPGVKVALVLEGTDRYAGDNYKVEASFDPAFACEHDTSCSTTATITAWKRIYIRPYKMFSYGAFLAEDANVGDTGITVRENTAGEAPAFHPGQSLLLIHKGEHQRQPESVTIISAPTAPGLLPVVDRLDGTWFIRLSAPLMNAYGGPDNPPYPVTADAVGVPTDYFETSLTGLADFYATMFVDAVTLRDQTFDQFPFVFSFGGHTVQDIAARGMLSRRFLGAPFELPMRANVFRVIGAGNYLVTHSAVACSTNFGDTPPGGDYSFEYVGNILRVHRGEIMAPCPIALPLQFNNLDGVSLGAVAHETLHQWNVNHDPLHTAVQHAGAGGPDGHCTAAAANPPGLGGDICLMHWQYPIGIANTNWDQLNTPRLALHWLEGGADSEYTQVRSHEEPVH